MAPETPTKETEMRDEELFQGLAQAARRAQDHPIEDPRFEAMCAGTLSPAEEAALLASLTVAPGPTGPTMPSDLAVALVPELDPGPSALDDLSRLAHFL